MRKHKLDNESPFDCVTRNIMDYKNIYGKVPNIIFCEVIPAECKQKPTDKTGTIKIDDQEILLAEV